MDKPFFTAEDFPLNAAAGGSENGVSKYFADTANAKVQPLQEQLNDALSMINKCAAMGSPGA